MKTTEIKKMLNELNQCQTSENAENLQKTLDAININSKYETALVWAKRVSDNGLCVLCSAPVVRHEMNRNRVERDIMWAVSYPHYSLRYNEKLSAYEIKYPPHALSVADLVNALAVYIADGYTNRNKDNSGLHNRPTKEDRQQAEREFFAHDSHAVTLFMWGSNGRTSLDEKVRPINYTVDEKERELFTKTSGEAMQKQLRYVMAYILPDDENGKPADISMFIKRHARHADAMINPVNKVSGRVTHGNRIDTANALVITARYALNHIDIPEKFTDALYNFSDDHEIIPAFTIR